MTRVNALTDANRGSGVANLYCDDGTVAFTNDGDNRTIGVSVTSQTASGFESTDTTVEITQDGDLIDLVTRATDIVWSPTIAGTNVSGVSGVSAEAVQIMRLGATNLQYLYLLTAEFTCTVAALSEADITITLPTGVTGGRGAGEHQELAAGCSVNNLLVRGAATLTSGASQILLHSTEGTASFTITGVVVVNVA